MQSLLMLLGIALLVLIASLLLAPTKTLTFLTDASTKTRLAIGLATPTSSLAATGPIVPRRYRGVEVCTLAKVDTVNYSCPVSRLHVSLKDYRTERLTMAGYAGTRFTTPSLSIVISRKVNGGMVEIDGHATQPVMLTMNFISVRLHDIFDSAHVVPKAGTSYVIEVDDGNRSLGDRALIFTQ